MDYPHWDLQGEKIVNIEGLDVKKLNPITMGATPSLIK
jgi:hypothetical protein